uniref:ABC transmembrane type-1 domain-containing protein n=1 Tax=Mesocestoides corti TaxID=53468 RepID=A0A5K3FRC0_MESCO
DFCLNYGSNYVAEWNSHIPRLTECEIYITLPTVIFSFLALVSLPYIILLALKNKYPRRLTVLFLIKNFLYVALLAILLWKFENISNSANRYSWNYLYLSSICSAVLFQLLIVNLEVVRDRPSSGVYFLCSLLLFVVTLLSAWTTFSYKLRPPTTDLLGVANASSPPGWDLSISPHELTDYLLCAVAFINFICSFFSDRRVLKLGSANDLLCIASHPKAVGDCHGQYAFVMGSDVEMKSLSNDNETVQHLCPEKYASFPSRITFFWFTKLIIKGYRKTLKMSDLWALEDKHISASLGSRFYPRIAKYLRVSISGVMDSSLVSSHKFRYSPPSLDSAFNLSSDEQKSSVGPLDQTKDAVVSAKSSTVSSFRSSRSLPDDRRSKRWDPVGDVGIEEEEEDEESKEWIEGDSNRQRHHRTISREADHGRHAQTSTSSSIWSNYRIRLTGLFKRPQSQATSSISGDLESGMRTKRASDSARKSSVSGRDGVLEEPKQQRKNRLNGGLIMSLFVTFGWRMFIAATFKLIHVICLLSGPIILKYLLTFLGPDSTEPRWHGYAYACLMFSVAVIQTIVFHQYFRTQTLIGMDIRTILISAVYRKSLRLSSAARCESTTGEITNLMSIDAQRFCALMLNIHTLWSAPLEITVAIYLLWGELGPSVLAGIAILLVMIPINVFVARKSKILQEKQLKTTDSRIKLISEILNGIRVVSLVFYLSIICSDVGSDRDCANGEGMRRPNSPLLFPTTRTTTNRVDGLDLVGPEAVRLGALIHPGS